VKTRILVDKETSVVGASKSSVLAVAHLGLQEFARLANFMSAFGANAFIWRIGVYERLASESEHRGAYR
jgi:hypothetical protein